MVNYCACGFSVATRTSWTNENLGQKFVACKFYNHETGQRGCNTFEWVDEGMTEWERDVINILIAEKHRLATDNSLLKSRLVCDGYHKEKLVENLEKMKKRSAKQKDSHVAGKAMVRGDANGTKVVVLCVIVAVVVSFIVMKLFS